MIHESPIMARKEIDVCQGLGNPTGVPMDDTLARIISGDLATPWAWISFRGL